jgi:phage N-6-adenine-methyltransferase
MSPQYMNPSKSHEWGTPAWLFDRLNDEFHFTLDACATEEIAKCPRFFSIQEDALLQRWEKSTWVNPPYGPSVKLWVRKSYEEALRGNLVVMLLPARTDVEWFHRYCFVPGVEIRFIKGRVDFVSGGSGRSRAPFPSMVVIFRPPKIVKGIDDRSRL